MSVCSAWPHQRFSSSSRNAELPIIAGGDGGVTARLLVVDDEPRTAELTAEVLRRAGYTVDVAASGTEAVARARSSAPDLMLLDYEMPDMQAPEVLDELRSGADRVAFPVIIFTGARHSSGDQVLGIERGATDYIAKGTDRQVLLARVRGALRERASGNRVLVRGRLRIDTAKGQASLDSKVLKLERRPLLMLQVLAAREGEVVTRAELLERVWGSTFKGFEHSVEQAAYELRRALKESGWIETVRGIGYRFVTQA
jgi:DNA-binding response OmpR family regulator